MADIELIVKIPHSLYANLSKIQRGSIASKRILECVCNGTPLEKHDEKVIKDTVASIWGKPPYTEVLDKITAEIKEKSGLIFKLNDYDLIPKSVLIIETNAVLQIIDKYRKRDKE